MYLNSIACTVPEQALTQREFWELFVNANITERLNRSSVEILRKVLLGDSGIAKRHFAMPDLERIFDLDSEALNRGFEREGPALAQRALDEALQKADLNPSSIDALFVCTCTGYICPGISSHVAEKAGMRPDAYLQDIVGLGCGAAIPTLRSASHFLCAHPSAKVAVVAVEICSAAPYLDNDGGVLISACLFGDGAAASIWSMQPDKTELFCHKFDTYHIPEQREKLRFENRFGKLRNRLHRSVPELASQAVDALFKKCDRDAVDCVISHSGGRDVLRAIQSILPHDYALDESYRVLQNYGNMSSPSVLFGLQDHLEGGEVGENLWLTTFGAGFACQACQISKV